MAKTGMSVEWLARIVLLSPEVLLSIVLGTVLFGGLGWWLATRYRWRRWAALGAAAALALALSVTLVRARSLEFQGLSALTHCLANGPRVESSEEFLNLVLLAPLGFFLALAWRRVLPACVAVLVLAVGVEAAQALFALGTCETRDVFGNVAGGVCGALLGWMCCRIGRATGVARPAELARPAERTDEVTRVP